MHINIYSMNSTTFYKACATIVAEHSHHLTARRMSTLALNRVAHHIRDGCKKDAECSGSERSQYCSWR